MEYKICKIENLITLCNRCHTQTNSYRKYWLEFYSNIKTIYL